MRPGQRPSRHIRNVHVGRHGSFRRRVLVNPDIRKVTNQQYRHVIRRLAPLADYDKDKIRNWKDCYPFDKTKQDSKPNKLMKARIDKLPIYYTSFFSDPYDPGDIGELPKVKLSKAPKQVRNKIYSVLKNYPARVRDVERTKTRVLFTDREIPYMGFSSRIRKDIIVGLKSGNKLESFIDVSKAIKNPPLVLPTSWSSIKEKDPLFYSKASLAGTLGEETQHQKQYVAVKKDPEIEKQLPVRNLRLDYETTDLNLPSGRTIKAPKEFGRKVQAKERPDILWKELYGTQLTKKVSSPLGKAFESGVLK